MDMQRIDDVERLVESQELVLGKRSREVANNLAKLGSLEVYEAEYAKAESCFLRALDIKVEVCGPIHADVLDVVQRLVELYRKQERSADLQRLEEWERLLVQALEAQEAQKPKRKVDAKATSGSQKKSSSSKRSASVSTETCNRQPTGSFAKPHPNSEWGRMASPASAEVAVVTGVVVGTAGDQFTLRKQNVWIGRDWMNDIAITKDESAERSHAMIAYEEGEYWIVNRATARATTINGIPVRVKAKLDPGDVVTIGRTNLYFT